ncbi:MAG: respiratory chain complex I subunit 1 family protein [Gammaproteobacteria bacterium]
MVGDIILQQVFQVLVILALSPLLQGFIVTLEAKIERGRGPSIIQPYRDLYKLFHKEQLIPQSASLIFWLAPLVAFTAMLTVPLLIPVLTNYPLPLSDMGDILGGGLILTLGGFAILLAGLDSGHPYGGLGSSREVMLAILVEPTLIMVFIGITLLARSMLPFVVNHLLVAQPAVFWSPAHVLLVAAFLILLTVETEQLPIHSTTHHEIYMIGEARILEYSGPLLGCLRWASWMKRAILYTIFMNVLTLPWGLSTHGTGWGLLFAAVMLLIKWGIVGTVMAVIDTVQSRLRFYRYQEPLALSFLLAILAVVAHQL